MTAIGAGIGDHLNLDRRQRTVALGPELHSRRHLVARRSADELLLAGEFPFHRAAGLEQCEHAEVLGEHLLLAAEAAADALGEDVQVARPQAEDVAELLLGDEGCLRAGADVNPAVVTAPGNRAVCFKMHVLNARGGVGHLVHGVGGLEAVRHAADLAVDVDVDIAFLGPLLVVQERRIRRHRGDRIEHRGQRFIGDVEQPAGIVGRSLGLGDDGGDALADEAHDVVEHVGIVGVDQMVLVGRRAVEPARHVLPGENLDHPRNGERLVASDGDDARVGMGRAQHLQMQYALHRHIHRVARPAGDDALAERVRQAGAAGAAGDVVFNCRDAGKRIADGAIARTAAQVALESMGQVRLLLLVERGRGHDHAGRAEAALERLGVEEGLLHGMQHAVPREPFDRRDLAPGRPKCRHQAGMHGGAVEPDRAGAAIAGVAAFLDAEDAAIAQERAQALPGSRRGREQLAVDAVVQAAGGRAGRMRPCDDGVLHHARAPGCASSARICSAK